MIRNVSGYSPFPDNLYIAPSKIDGMGLFAKINIAKDFDFGVSHVKDARFTDGYIRTALGAFVNHSVNPNCTIYEGGDLLGFRAIKDISKDEELTIDYTPYYNSEVLAQYK